jgi:hypothetical protein
LYAGGAVYLASADALDLTARDARAADVAAVAHDRAAALGVVTVEVAVGTTLDAAGVRLMALVGATVVALGAALLHVGAERMAVVFADGAAVVHVVADRIAAVFVAAEVTVRRVAALTRPSAVAVISIVTGGEAETEQER